MMNTMLERRFLYPDEAWTPLESPVAPESLYASLGRLPTLQDAEDLLIQEALRRTKGNLSRTAKLLGTTRQKIYRWLHSRTPCTMNPVYPSNYKKEGDNGHP